MSPDGLRTKQSNAKKKEASRLKTKQNIVSLYHFLTVNLGRCRHQVVKIQNYTTSIANFWRFYYYIMNHVTV